MKFEQLDDILTVQEVSQFETYQRNTTHESKYSHPQTIKVGRPH